METVKIPAAQYLRMSTEAQDYSLLNQAEVITEFAQRHGFEVVKTYADAAKSGLLLRNRPGLQQLLADVVNGDIPFRFVLVLDVSRWGRFQDIDEAAYYEYTCKAAGVPVIYCAEPFGTANTLINFIYKALKRSMAGEYSRELSAKVEAAHRRFAQLGFKQGGQAGFGLRRLAVAADGTPRHILNRGEHKGVHSDRVRFVRGPVEEVNLLKEIFQSIASRRQSVRTIVRELNQRGVANGAGTSWTPNVLFHLLRNPKYKGMFVYGKTQRVLGSKATPVPAEQWIVLPRGIEPIVSEELFTRAQQALASRTWGRSDDELLDRVRRLLNEVGYLDRDVIDHCAYTPAVSTLQRRFGSLGEVYSRLGYKKGGWCTDLRAHRGQNRTLLQDLIESLTHRDGINLVQVPSRRVRPQIRVGDAVITVRVARCHRTRGGHLRWSVNATPSTQQRRHILELLARLNSQNTGFYDFCIVNAESLIETSSWLKAEDDTWLKGGARFHCLGELCRKVAWISERMAGERG